MSMNFLIVWAIPIMGMGWFYKKFLKWALQPLYLSIDQNPQFRAFASKWLYTKPEHADFFAMSILVVVNCSVSIPTMFFWQLRYGHLPYWLIFAYYCSWVGLGGSIMGAAYALAHKEVSNVVKKNILFELSKVSSNYKLHAFILITFQGHYFGLYQKYVRESIGHFFENWLGVFFGNVPHNFSTSHNYIHHRLDGGMGDTFYEWDIDRTSLSDFMLYVHRIFLHMIGYSSIKFFHAHAMKSKADQLMSGIKTYWGVVFAVLAITRSPSFVFWLILEPLLCMTYFLALINIGFHGFVEFDENGKHIETVNSTAIVDGEDDMFGEDDHMAHHYNTNVYFRDLQALQKTKEAEFARTRASVFKKLSVVELSIFILLGLWDKLADYYMDYSGKMTREEIKSMLKTRAQCKEVSYERYQEYLDNPTPDARKDLPTTTLRPTLSTHAGASDTPDLAQ